MNAVGNYRELRKRVTAQAGGLEQLHCAHLACRPGCHECCTNLTVFPVEFHAILEDLSAMGMRELPLDHEAGCDFLDRGLCRIYALRPMICRTHGLPVAFLNEDDETPAMSVSFCPKNFTQGEQVEFGPENTLDLDELNMELYAINRAFLEGHPELGLGPSDRIPLSRLAEELKRE
jgi:Fe-S-cluster containining protein